MKSQIFLYFLCLSCHVVHATTKTYLLLDIGLHQVASLDKKILQYLPSHIFLQSLSFIYASISLDISK